MSMNTAFSLKPLSELNIVSPYLYMGLADGLSGSNPASVVIKSNVIAETAAIVGTPANVWAEAGYATFDGANDYIKEAHSNLTGLESVLRLGDGIVMVWGCFNSAVAGNSVLFSAGCNAPAPGFEVRVDGGGNSIRARATDGTTFKDTGSSAAAWTDNTDTNFAVVLNNTAAKKVDFYVNGNIVNGAVTLSGLGTVNFGTAANQFFMLGGAWSGSPGSLNLAYTGKVKRLGVINFGSTLPDNILAIVQGLARHQSIPGWFMDGA